jgi:site-specific DNA-methyltransferase (adenine-specific)
MDYREREEQEGGRISQVDGMTSLSASVDKSVGKDTRIAYLNRSGILFNGDCLDLLAAIRTNSIDLCFTDPPFNLGKNYAIRAYHDRMAKKDYYDWCNKWIAELIRVLKPGGTLCIYQMPQWAIDIGSMLNKRNDVAYRSLIGVKMKSFPLQGRLQPSMYTILYYTKNGKEPVFNIVRYRAPTCRHCKKEIRDYGGYRQKFRKFEDDSGVPWVQISDIWEDTRPARQDKSRGNLVNELPFHIPERIILMASQKNDVVLDIFGGGGSTFHAAQEHGRYWIGCEIGSTKSCLSRFATLWGRKETRTLVPKLRVCFDPKYLRHYVAKKRIARASPIMTVPILKNGRSLSRDSVISKSRVIDF